MESYKRTILLLNLLLCCWTSYGQTGRYVVFFSDKTDTPYSIEAPETFLSQRAIDRRVRQNIPITAEDLPVNPAYLDSIKVLGAEVYFTTKWLNGVLVQTEESLVTTLEALEFVSAVEFVAPGAALTPIRESDPGLVPEERFDPGNLSNTVQREMIGGDAMAAAGLSGAGIQIALLDGGFRNVNSSSYFRDMLEAGQYLGGKDYVTAGDNPFQYSTHGTGALSTIVGDAGPDFKGMAPDAAILLLVTEDVSSEYRIEEYNWLFGAEYADSLGIDILSTSLGYVDFDDPTMDYTPADLDGATAVITRAGELAFQKGMLVVTSAGNSGGSAWRLVTTPADGPNILAVGAVDAERAYASFSSVGPTADGRIKPDVVAMGRSTALFRSDFTNSSGTSFSAPQIAGLAAGLWQANPEWTNRELFDAIRERGSRSKSPNNELGYGIPHFEAERVLYIPEPAAPRRWKVYPNPLTEDHLLVEIINPQEVRSIVFYDESGKQIPASGEEISEHKLSFDLTPLRSGVYFITLHTLQGSETLRILKSGDQ